MFFALVGEKRGGTRVEDVYASAPGRRITIRPMRCVMRCMLTGEDRRRGLLRQALRKESLGAELFDHQLALLRRPLLTDLVSLARDIRRGAYELLSERTAIERNDAVEILLRVVLVVHRDHALDQLIGTRLAFEPLPNRRGHRRKTPGKGIEDLVDTLISDRDRAGQLEDGADRIPLLRWDLPVTGNCRKCKDECESGSSDFLHRTAGVRLPFHALESVQKMSPVRLLPLQPTDHFAQRPADLVLLDLRLAEREVQREGQ